MFYEPPKIACGSVCIKNVVILVDIVIALPVGRANANAQTDSIQKVSLMLFRSLLQKPA